MAHKNGDKQKIQVVKPQEVVVPDDRSLIKNVAFFGDANISQSDPVYQDAFAVSKMLAERGFAIVNGGGPGVMDASTQGAIAGNGETISVTFYPKDATNFEGRYLGNVTSEEIVTSNYIERMFKLMEHSDMFIIFKGGSGTISELGTAWVLANIYFGHHKPFLLYGEFWLDIIDSLRRNMNIDSKEMSVFEIVTRREDVYPAIRWFDKQLKRVRKAKFKEGKAYTK